jgi:hypothetical protein
MSSLIYPAPSATPGITYGSVRAPSFKTGLQRALTGKESRIAYQQYPIMTWELTYELLRDYVTPSELKAMFGLYMQVSGMYDTFLYSDPVFNSVTAMPFATTQVGDVAGTPYQITAVYENTGGPGGNELIQNFNGTPAVQGNGTLISAANYSISGSGILTFNATHQPASGTVLSWTGAFYYRVRFDDDSLDFSQFMNQFWELKKVKLRQVKL